MTFEPTFAQRCERLQKVSKMLAEMKEILHIVSHYVSEEAERMAAAEKRFSERRKKRNGKASR